MQPLVDPVFFELLSQISDTVDFHLGPQRQGRHLHTCTGGADTFPKHLGVKGVHFLKIPEVGQKDRGAHNPGCISTRFMKHRCEVLEHLTGLRLHIAFAHHRPGAGVEGNLSRAIEPVARLHRLVVRADRGRSRSGGDGLSR